MLKGSYIKIGANTCAYVDKFVDDNSFSTDKIKLYTSYQQKNDLIIVN